MACAWLQVPKSIQNDVNWGVRFATLGEAKQLINDVAEHVATRLKNEGMVSGSVTLKIRNRRPGAGEPMKTGGHGVCDQWSRTAQLVPPARAAAAIAAACHRLITHNTRHVDQIRGLGIALGKLSRRKLATAGAPVATQKTLAQTAQLQERKRGAGHGLARAATSTRGYDARAHMRAAAADSGSSQGSSQGSSAQQGAEVHGSKRRRAEDRHEPTEPWARAPPPAPAGGRLEDGCGHGDHTDAVMDPDSDADAFTDLGDY